MVEVSVTFVRDTRVSKKPLLSDFSSKIEELSGSAVPIPTWATVKFGKISKIKIKVLMIIL